MRRLLFLMYCCPPALALAAPFPDLQQVQAALAAEMDAGLQGRSTGTQVAAAMFAPRLNALPWCVPAEDGAVDCSVGYERGIQQRHRMMRLSPQGDAWRLQSTRLQPPQPALEALSPQLQARIEEAVAAGADASEREGLRADFDGMRLTAVDGCDLAQASGQLQCDLLLAFDSGRDGRIRVGLQRAGDQWRLDPLPLN
ncbi:hypothetical protein [Stenotrophomonas sp.]|uniref:hypothetical protein n=1 Tax=Stenotrophomonas sp. TaxID=69392 RepID=UPI002D2C40ED|nr:hypothetical protein [Stenotrophomonas sp.]HYQ24037.1 hypothetical protein [Stenotrophomonas sp.]